MKNIKKGFLLISILTIIIVSVISGCETIPFSKNNSSLSNITNIQFPSGEYLSNDTAEISAVISNTSKSEAELCVKMEVINNAGTSIFTTEKTLTIKAETTENYCDSWTIPENISTGRYQTKLTVSDNKLENKEKLPTTILEESSKDTFICYSTQENFDSLDQNIWGVSEKKLGATTFSPDNVTVKNGQLLMTFPANEFGGGEIFTKSLHGYGIYEVRMKLPQVPNSLTGFFMYKAPEYHHEIDIDVFNDSEGNILTSTYADGQIQNDHLGKTGFDPTADFHNYRFEYTPDEVAFYIDDTLAKSWNDGFTDEEMSLMLNCWFPKYLNGTPLEIDQHLYVDWIRY